MDSLILEEVVAQLEAGQTLTAFQLMKKLSTLSDKQRQDISYQIGRLNRLEKDIHDGLIPVENLRIERNRIAKAADFVFNKIKEPMHPELAALLSDVPGSTKSKSEILDELTEKLVGGSQLKQISWLSRGLDSAKAVCRIAERDGTAVGTGFLLEDGCLMTNNHVINDFTDTARLVAQFNYEFDTNGDQKEFFSYDLDKTGYFKTSENLDYTKIKVAPNPAHPTLSNWGYLKLVPKTPIAGEHVSIIQHPLGNQKQIALNENQVVYVKSETIEYTTDTEAGSSGAPVFNDYWEVVALHRAASANNETNIATRMNLILEHLKA